MLFSYFIFVKMTDYIHKFLQKKTLNLLIIAISAIKNNNRGNTDCLIFIVLFNITDSIEKKSS